jgi:hypothetical protein
MKTTFVMAMLTLGTTSLSAGTIVTTPAGLAPGAQYQLLFVTADEFAATSSSISVYNTDVSNEAALNPTLAQFDSLNGVTWTVIGSTASVSASVNAASTGSVYTLNGVMVADSANSLYSIGFSGNLFSAPDITQFAVLQPFVVWTGSGIDGSISSQPLGNSGGSGTVAGGPNTTNFCWISCGASDAFSSPTPILPLYALSSVITVPASTASTPEPSTFILLIAGLLVVLGYSGTGAWVDRALP